MPVPACITIQPVPSCITYVTQPVLKVGKWSRRVGKPINRFNIISRLSCPLSSQLKSVPHLVVTTQKYLLYVKRVPAQHLRPCPGQHPTSTHHPVTASHNPSIDFQFPGLFWPKPQNYHSLQWKYTGELWLQAIAGLITETSWVFWYHNMAAQPPELLPWSSSSCTILDDQTAAHRIQSKVYGN